MYQRFRLHPLAHFAIGVASVALVTLSLGWAAAAEPANLALGRPYKVEAWEPNEEHEKIAQAYPDTGGVELTDGKPGDPEDFYNAGWVGFLRQGGRTITIDLGQEMDLSEVSIRFLKVDAAGIGLPNMVQASFSTDGSSYGPIIDLTAQADTEQDQAAIPYAAKLENTKARYVRVEFDVPIWIFADEIQVFGK